MATKKPLLIEGARALGEAGVIKHVRVTASAQGLYVEINGIFFVANRTKEVRYFAKADTCFSWLREIGAMKVDEVDLTEWGNKAQAGNEG